MFERRFGRKPINDAQLAALFRIFDDLHSAASEGELSAVTPLNPRDLMGWLNDIEYTLQEIKRELWDGSARH